MWGLVLGVAGLFALDAAVFRSGLYTAILEPESSAGTFELILRRERNAQRRRRSSSTSSSNAIDFFAF